MKTLLSLFLFLCFLSFAQAQGKSPLNPKPGKCYAQSLIIPQPIEIVKNYPVYTGSNPESVELETVEIVTQKASTKWEKKGQGNDAIWCLVEVPAVVETLLVVKDIEQIQDYSMVSITIKHFKEATPTTEWREVICKEKINKKLVLKIQTSLQTAGYYDGKIQGKLNSKTKNALSAYQRDNGLPIGNLDRETMKMLRSY